jgi:FkbM family methyltransferase
MVEIAGFKVKCDTNIERWRVDTFWTKEPETLAWIESMKPGEVLYDIGANIGVYTLYAASRGIQVVAVEPVLENYMRLVENIEMNRMQELVIPVYGACACGAEASWFDDLVIPDNTTGASGAQVGQDMEGRRRIVPVYDLEYLFFSLDLYPHRIKIDVDGNEREIFMSAVYDHVESVLVEINPERWPMETAIIDFADIGFIPDPAYNEMTPHSSERRQREGIAAVNMVFKREEV